MSNTTRRQIWMAQRCVQCPLCGYARKRQKGVLYALARVESSICPFCRAYEKVYGRKSYEPHEV
ncbi:MAG: hypothetical protein JW720_14705 [Sedimentisphaerales bacterium]|nr:hypothetical protein [Sedimentisphaerales bacterium]